VFWGDFEGVCVCTAALNKSLAAHQQDHVPMPSWKADADEIVSGVAVLALA
jgi:hypothetical protein